MTMKNKYLLLWATEELSATITVRATFFSFRGLTKKEISVIMGLRRKVWDRSVLTGGEMRCCRKG